MHGDINILLILWNSGFVVKIVLGLLIFASILSWAIIIQKKKVLNTIERSNEDFNIFFKSSHNLADIYTQTNVNEDSTLGIMFSQGYLELVKIKEQLNTNNEKMRLKDYFRQAGMNSMERSLKLGVNICNEKLENRLSTLASIGSVSPFIGLFGTVWGIIDSFTGLASGGGSIEAVAPGIAEALVATAVGLAAAIPAVWAYNVFNNRIGKLNAQMESFGQEFLNLVERSVLIGKDH